MQAQDSLTKPQGAGPAGEVGRRLWLILLGWMVYSFTVGALTKFYWGDTWFGPAYSVKFTDWGYPSWFRFCVGAGELVGALMLINPRLRFLGAGILAVITFGGTVTHIANQDPLSHSISAPIHFVLALIVVWITRRTHLGARLTGRAPDRAAR